jgi:Na+/H+ antiporter NhaB
MSRDVLAVGINTYTHLPSLSAPAEDAEAIDSSDGQRAIALSPQGIVGMQLVLLPSERVVVNILPNGLP